MIRYFVACLIACLSMVGTNGQEPRNAPKILRITREPVLPGQANLDSSLFKNIGRERFHAQFRAEFFNILNHANFRAPLSNLTIFGANGAPTANAGLINSTTTTSRQIQFG